MDIAELPSHFGDLLHYFVQREHRSAGQLAEITQVPLKTMQSWLEGRVTRPRDWKSILIVAGALNLTRTEVDRLLNAANHKGLEELSSFIRAAQERPLLDLLVNWETVTAKAALTPVITNPEAVFQAVPAPAQLYGRDLALAQLKQAVRAGKQICILQGMPGVGKTALAAKAAYELRAEFPDGVLWAQVDKSDTMSILYSFAYAFGREVSEFQDLETRSAVVRDVLAKKKCLIVLDSTYQTEEIHLLRPPSTSPSVVLITTTNRRVLDAEATLIELQPFGGPQRAAGLAFFADLPVSAATSEEAQALEKMIDLVGGLPLALRIIASDLAQSSYLSAVEYYDYLFDERTRLENLSDWQETSKDVRASFEMSYNRLPTTLKTLFCSLAVFKKAEFSVEAAAAVMQMPLPKMKKALAQLEALSLIEPYAVRDRTWLAVDQPVAHSYLERYRLHTLLFIFVTEKLAALQADYHARALAYYGHYVQRNHTHNALLALEWENIADLLNWGAALPVAAPFLPLLEALTLPQIGVVGFLDARGYWRQAHHWLACALQPGQADRFLLARLHFKCGFFALRLALATAETHLQQAAQLLSGLAEDEAHALYHSYVCETLAQWWMSRDRQQALAWSEWGVNALAHVRSATAQHQRGYLLIRHGTILAQRGELAAGQQLIEDAFALLPEEPSAARISGLLSLGNIFDIQGDTERARHCWLEGVQAAQALADYRRLAGLWLNLAIQAEEQGQFAQCEEFNERALQLYRQIGDIDGEGRVLSNLAFNYLRQEKFAQAWPYLEEAARVTADHALHDLEVHVKANYARYYLLQGHLAQAEAFLAQAQALSEQIEESETLSEITRLQAQVALQQGDYTTALTLIEASLAAADDQGSEAGLGWGVKGEILMRQGHVAEAKVAFQRSLKLLDDYPFDLAVVKRSYKEH